MTTRVSVRQRNPDLNKPLQVIRTYPRYAEFEVSLTDTSHLDNSGESLLKRVEELKYESSKTLEALKQKQPVRIPEMKPVDEQALNGTSNGKSKFLYLSRL